MSYLEESELVIGVEYLCQLYDGSPSLVLVYVGDGQFEDDEYTYSLSGDVRYVTTKGNRNERYVDTVPIRRRL